MRCLIVPFARLLSSISPARIMPKRRKRFCFPCLIPVSYTHLDVYKRQLYNHAFFFVVECVPRPPDIALNRNGAGRTDRRALSAADTVCFRNAAVKRRRYPQIGTAVGEIDDSHAHNFITDADAVAAQDAFIPVSYTHLPRSPSSWKMRSTSACTKKRSSSSPAGKAAQQAKHSRITSWRRSRSFPNRNDNIKQSPYVL